MGSKRGSKRDKKDPGSPIDGLGSLVGLGAAGSPVDAVGSLVGLGTPASQLLNAASEAVAALEHARTAGADFFDAISYLDKLNRGSAGGAAGLAGPLGAVGKITEGRSRGPAVGVPNPLGVVGKIAGGATGLGGLLGGSGGRVADSPRSKSGKSGKAGKNDKSGKSNGSGGRIGPANPISAVADALNGVLGDATRQLRSNVGGPAAAESTAGTTVPISAAGPFPTPLVQNLASSLGLPGNELINAVGTAANAVTRPVADQVGEGLKLAQNLTGAPLQGVGDLVGKVLGADGSAETAAALRERGSRLVRISYKPEFQRRDLHPSFSRIIDELLPDEARILRFMGVAGTQPMIDVRTKTLFQVGSVLLVGGISMIAQMAGCHWPDRDQHYFANLHRLGMLSLSREPVDDYRRYALLEVQPVAVTAIESVPKAVTVYRSVRLTAFGSQFVDVCIDTEGYTAGGWDTDGRQDKIKGKGPPEKRAAKHA